MARRKSTGSGSHRGRKRPQIPFPERLALNQWLLSLFGVERFDQLAEPLKREELEGLDENNVHRFHHALLGQFQNLKKLPPELLLEYDQNIVRHTLRLGERRITRGEAPIVWKYFQYLALLFTEIYLDRYFRDPAALLADVNRRIEYFNAGHQSGDRLSPLDESGEPRTRLNKLAFWMATGSGKTLLMHANILQYQFYLQRPGKHEAHGGRRLNRILLLTPNEGLSRQHLREFETAGIDAELFDKNGRGLFAGRSVEIIEVTRLREEMGDRTVAIESFEENNLVLVDEGHRGASGGEAGAWMKARSALCEQGFSFEYSATFQQAVAGSERLSDQYAKTILFNYSYRYFYEDGFGKDYQILNLDRETQEGHLELYLAACLLTYFQQLRLFREQRAAFRPFAVEKPLWIFVGGSVTKTLARRDASDIIEIVKFLDRYASDRAGSIERIERVLSQGLETAYRKNLFAGRFHYLNTCGLSAEKIFEETLAELFNAPGGGRLYVENLKGAAGEVALRLGAGNDPFGVINVGDDAKLVKLCGEHALDTGEREFSGSLFHNINAPGSTVNVLIGSKKFTEGWSSWRVSTMGLMNVGRGEGAQIIQLFGRGVRLKGHRMSLKRSGKTRLPEEVKRPPHITALETLGIFGIQADYMAEFQRHLKEEGLPANEEPLEFLLPVIKNLGRRPLKTIRLKQTIGGVSTQTGDPFRSLGPLPTLQRPNPQADPATAYLQKNQVVLNWYPKIRGLRSSGLEEDAEAKPHETHLGERHLAFLDFQRLYFELERFKAERGWHNLNLTQGGIRDLLGDGSWYRLRIPAEEMSARSFAAVALWEEIALALLKKYTERYYTFRKRQWELPHLEYQDLLPDDPNLLGAGESADDPYYRIQLDRSQEEILARLVELKEAIEARELKHVNFRGLLTLWFDQHLYRPLLYLAQRVVDISPVPLNKGERAFVEDLKKFHQHDGGFFEGKELYLLRNLSKGRGIGFFEAGNFHPDFILWLLAGETQHVIFVDPKGIRQLPPGDPKIEFYEKIKEIEERLGDPGVKLHSFIVSGTPSHVMRGQWMMEKEEMQRRHVLFQEEDRESYIRRMLETAAGASAGTAT